MPSDTQDSQDGGHAEGTRHEDHETEVYGQFHACKDCKTVIEYV